MPATVPPASSGFDKLLVYITIGTAVLFVLACTIMMGLLRKSESNVPAVSIKPSIPIVPDHPRQLVDFSLIDRTGRTITRVDLARRILVVDFLLTSCSLTCPEVNRQMVQIQKLTAADPNVLLLSLTVDPRDDTPEVLAKYGARFSADTNRWLFLTGQKSELYNVIKTSFLNDDLDDASGYMPGNFSHTERIAIVDRSGAVRAYFDGLKPDTAKAVTDEIAKIRSEAL